MTKPHLFRWSVSVGLVLFVGLASAQNIVDNPDWVEEKASPPPAYSKTDLIPIDMPRHVSLKVGVDPATVRVGEDGIVRYVVVMTNASGTVNAAYEGIRCLTDEFKTYARVGSSGEWTLVSDPQWKHVNDNMPSKHPQAIARQGACKERLALSTAEALKALKENKNRFQPVKGP